MPLSPIYSKTFIIPSDAIDENGHVNNVAYVQWMQDIAVEHYESIGGTAAQGKDVTWVVREHRIEYFLPAFAGEEIQIKTWVETFGASGLCANMNSCASQMGRSWSKVKQIGYL